MSASPPSSASVVHGTSGAVNEASMRRAAPSMKRVRTPHQPRVYRQGNADTTSTPRHPASRFGSCRPRARRTVGRDGSTRPGGTRGQARPAAHRAHRHQEHARLRDLPDRRRSRAELEGDPQRQPVEADARRPAQARRPRVGHRGRPAHRHRAGPAARPARPRCTALRRQCLRTSRGERIDLPAAYRMFVSDPHARAEFARTLRLVSATLAQAARCCSTAPPVRTGPAGRRRCC